MSTTTTPGTTTSRRKALIPLALVAVYFIWGSTYLGILFGLEGFPPLAMNAFRFLTAGAILYVWQHRRGVPSPTLVQWRNAAAVGALLLIGGVGLVTIAEDLGVGSGLAATAVAVMPLWAAVWAGVFEQWPGRREWLGLVLGFAGVVLLAQEGDFQSTAVGTLLVILAPIFWSFGSVWSRRLDLPANSMATAAQLLSGGVVFGVLSLALGESFDGFPSPKAWGGLLYLTLFGSVVAYNAYVFLLRNVRPALATSYAYANPIVAIVLGITIGAETLTGPAWAALPMILTSLALVGYARRDRRGGTLRAEPAGTRAIARP